MYTLHVDCKTIINWLHNFNTTLQLYKNKNNLQQVFDVVCLSVLLPTCY